MKTILAIVLTGIVSWNCLGQVTARRLTRKIVPPPTPAQSPKPAPAVARPTPPPSPAVVVPVAPPDPAKVKAAKEEALKKRIEFLQKRADDGSPSAQYELGLLYLKGQGLVKNADTAKSWFEKAAKNGNKEAAKKLQELGEKR